MQNINTSEITAKLDMAREELAKTPSHIENYHSHFTIDYKSLTDIQLIEEAKVIRYLLEKNQKDPETLYRSSQIYLEKNNLQAAYDCIEKAICLNSAIDHFHSLKGDILSAAKEDEHAISAYHYALSINPNNNNAIKKLLATQNITKNQSATIKIYKTLSLRDYCTNHDATCIDIFAEENIIIKEPLLLKKQNSRNTVHQYKTPKAYIAELNDIHIIGHAGYVVTRDNKILDDELVSQDQKRSNLISNIEFLTLIYHYQNKLSPEQSEVMAIVAKETIEIEDCILLTARGTKNYFHWLIEVIPKLSLLENHHQYTNIPLLIPAGMPKQHYEALKLIVGREKKLIFADINTHYFVKRAIIPSKLSELIFDYQPNCQIEYDDFKFNPIAMNYLRKKFLKPIKEKTKKRLYLTRKTSSMRRLVNEEEIEKLLIGYGFEVISPAEYTFEQQLGLFSSAEIIVGPSGATFSNIVFAPKNCKILLLSQHRENTHVIYHALANAAGIEEFYSVKGNIIENPDDDLKEYKKERAMHADFSIELTDIKKILDNITQPTTNHPHILTMTIDSQLYLVQSIINIIDRFDIRKNEKPHIALKKHLIKWQQTLVRNKHKDNDYILKWNELLIELLTTPQRFYSIFPEICNKNSKIFEFVKKINNEAYIPVNARSEVSAAKQSWISRQSDISSQDSLIRFLLSKLENVSESQGQPFQFFSCYFTFKDMLYSKFVNTDWEKPHQEIFGHLYRQNLNWSNTYCHGYAYQGFERIGISGIKPTETRMQEYNIDDYISKSMRILDIGSNCGFMSLYLSEKCSHVDALELNPYLTLIGKNTSKHLNINNVSFIEDDFFEFIPDKKYDVCFSLANHATIDEKLQMKFEDYIAKIFYLLNDNGYLFFETHNVFGPGLGKPGDDGDLDRKFDFVERYFEIVKMKMIKPYVTAHDVDKLFVVLKKKQSYQEGTKRIMDLESARLKYNY